MEDPKIKIFMIDDDKEVLRLYALHFELNGLNVVGTATNGIKAIKRLKNSIVKPDFIIIDYHMPIINGIIASKIILKIDNSFKIIMISGDPSIREKALSNGIIDFYEKPNNIENLCQRIKEIHGSVN
jgi:DNA-binding NtrC family response regulator